MIIKDSLLQSFLFTKYIYNVVFLIINNDFIINKKEKCFAHRFPFAVYLECSVFCTVICTISVIVL